MRQSVGNGCSTFGCSVANNPPERAGLVSHLEQLSKFLESEFLNFNSWKEPQADSIAIILIQISWISWDPQKARRLSETGTPIIKQKISLKNCSTQDALSFIRLLRAASAHQSGPDRFELRSSRQWRWSNLSEEFLVGRSGFRTANVIGRLEAKAPKSGLNQQKMAWKWGHIMIIAFQRKIIQFQRVLFLLYGFACLATFDL